MPSSTNAQHDEWVGAKLSNGRYLVEKIIGEGGMGLVFKGWDSQTERDVAIKVPHRHLLRDAEVLLRFRREIKTMTKVDHPNVVKLYDIGDHHGLPFAVLPFLAGGSLEARWPRDSQNRFAPAADLPAFVSLCHGIADALDAIHALKIIHRDLKPGNILFDSGGRPYLSDFGIVKALGCDSSMTMMSGVTGAGMIVGTLEYLAPEVLLGHDFDERIDQYALGVIVYELLTGSRPYVAPTPSAISERQRHPPTPIAQIRPDLSPGITAVVERALAWNAGARYASAREFTQMLGQTLLYSGDVKRQSAFAAGSGSTFRAASPGPAENGRTTACPTCGRTTDVRQVGLSRTLACSGCGTVLALSTSGRLYPVKSSDETARGASSSPTPQDSRAATQPPGRSSAVDLNPSALVARAQSATLRPQASPFTLAPPGGPGGADDSQHAGLAAVRADDSAPTTKATRNAAAGLKLAGVLQLILLLSLHFYLRFPDGFGEAPLLCILANIGIFLALLMIIGGEALAQRESSALVVLGFTASLLSPLMPAFLAWTLPALKDWRDVRRTYVAPSCDWGGALLLVVGLADMILSVEFALSDTGGDVGRVVRVVGLLGLFASPLIVVGGQALRRGDAAAFAYLGGGLAMTPLVQPLFPLSSLAGARALWIAGRNSSVQPSPWTAPSYLMTAFGLSSCLLWFYLIRLNLDSFSDHREGLTIAARFSGSLLAGCFALLAALTMRRRTNRRSAMACSIVAMLPFHILAPIFWIAGFWSLRALYRPEVRSQFAVN